MSTSVNVYIYGIRKADIQFSKMLAVLEACRAAGLDCPEPVLDYFGIDDIDDEVSVEGVQIPLGEIGDCMYANAECTSHDISVKDASEESPACVIDVKNIPKAVDFIRVAVRVC